MEIKDVKLAQGINIKKSIFDKDGGMLDFKLPLCYDLVILCGNKGGGHTPYKCLLPHQVYLSDIKNDFEKYNFEVITIFPVKSKTNSYIAYKGDYEKSRWQAIGSIK
jgi:hypothetical protein